MAKKNSFSPLGLFFSSCLLFAGGWMLAVFPILIFFAFAPLLALTDRAGDNRSVLEKMEWVMLALTVSFLAAHRFHLSALVASMMEGIMFTLPFIAHLWVRRTLGVRAGKITIMFFWLTLEYVLIKTIPSSASFLSDALLSRPEWTRWNLLTGYLGTTCWILAANLTVYQTIFSAAGFRWYWVVISLALVAGPIAYSYTLEHNFLSRADMIDLYTGKDAVRDVTYLARGEWLVRTAAWVSVLILLYTFVKSQTKRT